MHFSCPVCGFDGLEGPPYGSTGRGNHEICPACGFQFGFHDEVKGLAHKQWREDWIRRGMWWASEDLPPANWDPVRQLRSIGYDPCFARPAPDHDRSPDELRGAIAMADLESQAVADLIHEYCDHHRVTSDEKPIMERFLSSRSVRNRSAALAALISWGKFTGYDADALLLHFDSRDGTGSQEEYDALEYLRRLQYLGSAVARRMLAQLYVQPYVRKLRLED